MLEEVSKVFDPYNYEYFLNQGQHYWKYGNHDIVIASGSFGTVYVLEDNAKDTLVSCTVRFERKHQA